MYGARDDVYCHLVARRAVARAAMHLGMESVNAETLDVLGDVVLEYLQRIGRTLSHSVEASGRSSAHVNVLDAIRAIEINTAPAVTRVHPNDSNVDHNSLNEAEMSVPDASWKGLAAFLFGPEWHKVPNERKNSVASVNEADQPGGGKVGPGATGSSSVGWNAPYPEEIPHFPVPKSQSIANPHPFTDEKMWESLHTIVIETPSKDATEEKEDAELEKNQQGELSEIPEEVFQRTWGSMEEETKKRKRDSADEEEGEERPSKKGKKSEPSSSDNAATVNQELLLPNFYPPIPKAEDGYRSVPVEVPQKAPPADPHLVRTSLVQLDQGQNDYWGKIKSGPAVEPGKGSEGGPVGPQIVPLGRASGSRVSRILEGSIETLP